MGSRDDHSARKPADGGLPVLFVVVRDPRALSVLVADRSRSRAPRRGPRRVASARSLRRQARRPMRPRLRDSLRDASAWPPSTSVLGTRNNAGQNTPSPIRAQMATSDALAAV